MTDENPSNDAVEAAMRAWGVKGVDQRRIVECIIEAATPHLAAVAVEDLLSTIAGLALANAAYGEGLSAGIKACNNAKGGKPFRNPESPYSAPLLQMKDKP